MYESYLQSDLCQSGSTGMTHEAVSHYSLQPHGVIRHQLTTGAPIRLVALLDYEAICSEAKTKVVLRASTIAREVLRNIEQYHQFSAEIPIADVFEAAAMAHRILIRRPSLFSRFGNLIFRVIGLSKKWLRGRSSCNDRQPRTFIQGRRKMSIKHKLRMFFLEVGLRCYQVFSRVQSHRSEKAVGRL